MFLLIRFLLRTLVMRLLRLHGGDIVFVFFLTHPHAPAPLLCVLEQASPLAVQSQLSSDTVGTVGTQSAHRYSSHLQAMERRRQLLARKPMHC